MASIAKYRTCKQPNQWLIWIFRFSSDVPEMICLEYFLATTIRQGHGNGCHRWTTFSAPTNYFSRTCFTVLYRMRGMSQCRGCRWGRRHLLRRPKGHWKGRRRGNHRACHPLLQHQRQQTTTHMLRLHIGEHGGVGSAGSKGGSSTARPSVRRHKIRTTAYNHVDCGDGAATWRNSNRLLQESSVWCHARCILWAVVPYGGRRVAAVRSYQRGRSTCIQSPLRPQLGGLLWHHQLWVEDPWVHILGLHSQFKPWLVYFNVSHVGRLTFQRWLWTTTDFNYPTMRILLWGNSGLKAVGKFDSKVWIKGARAIEQKGMNRREDEMRDDFAPHTPTHATSYPRVW
jgi:hypothetical protein